MNLAYEAVVRAAPDCCVRDRNLAPFLTYKVGGPADVYAEPQTVEQLVAVVKAAHEHGLEPFPLGGGTNVIVRDGGFRGVVIRLGRAFRTVRTEGDRVVAGAAATMMQAAAEAERSALAGLEFGYDIPGTVGGAVRMNAGAHGSEIRDVLREVRGVTWEGAPVVVPVGEIRFSYRFTEYPVALMVTGARFSLAPGDPVEVAGKRRRFHAYRLGSQPKGRSVGSVFQNPEGDHAGRLIEAAGLKGHRVGGAVVSEKHANFILGDRGATAADIETLIRTVQTRVRERFGVELEPEVRIVGEPAPARKVAP